MLREIPSHALFTVLMVIGFFTIALAKFIAPKRFNDFILVIGNSKYLKIYSREQKFLDVHDGLLFINLVISITIFTCICFKHFDASFTVNTPNILKISTGISMFILAKVLLERLVASLFELDQIVDSYLFQKISYKNYIGILLLPANAFLIFSTIPHKPLLYSSIILTLLINISGLLTSFKVHRSEIKQNWFYFILYLCTLEIAPFIVIYSIFSA